MLHYNVDKQTLEIQKQVADNTLIGPEFIGQGCSYSPCVASVRRGRWRNED